MLVQKRIDVYLKFRREGAYSILNFSSSMFIPLAILDVNLGHSTKGGGVIVSK